MKYVMFLILGMVGGPIMWSMLNDSESASRVISQVFGIGVPVVAALLLLVIGGLVAVMLVKLGANITISATNSNDRWDAAKVKAYSDVFRMGASAGKSLPMGQQVLDADIGTGWIPVVEQYRLPAAGGED